MYKSINVKTIPVNDTEPDPDQPRKYFDDTQILALGHNILDHGQHVPIITYPVESRFVIIDGERRWRAAQLVGIAELQAIVLTERPDAASLRILQMSLEAHKVSLSAWERSCLLKRIRDANGWTVTELAARLQMKQPVVSKLLACQRLDAAIQKLLHEGSLDIEKAAIISQEPSFERQRELLKVYAHLPREQLRQSVRASEKPNQATTRRATFALSGGMSVSVQGGELSLPDAIQCLMEVVRELKRRQAEQLDIVAAQKLMREKARARNVLAKETPSAR